MELKFTQDVINCFSSLLNEKYRNQLLEATSLKEREQIIVVCLVLCYERQVAIIRDYWSKKDEENFSKIINSNEQAKVFFEDKVRQDLFFMLKKV